MARELIEPAVAERRIRLGYDAWRRWHPEGVRSEWVDGEVIVFVPTTLRHADVVGFLYVLLSSFVRFFDLGRVFMETVEMRLAHAGRVPDILFVARDHLAALETARLVGPGDLVVEVVSDDSVARDREEKLAECAVAGVPEYWLLDPRPGQLRADFLRLVDGAYQPIAPDAEGRVHSPVVSGFWLRPEWLWEEPVPDPVRCLDDIAPAALDVPRRRARAHPADDPA